MPRILLTALVGLAVLVVPAIAAGDSSKSPSSTARIVQQVEPNAVVPPQPGEVSAKPAGEKDSKTTIAAKDDEPGGAANDDVEKDDIDDVQASLNESQENLDDVDDGPVNDVDNEDVDDIDDEAVNDVEKGDVDDEDDADVNDVDEGDVDDEDDGSVED